MRVRECVQHLLLRALDLWQLVLERQKAEEERGGERKVPPQTRDRRYDEPVELVSRHVEEDDMPKHVKAASSSAPAHLLSVLARKLLVYEAFSH
jgi:hypothetical protein